MICRKYLFRPLTAIACLSILIFGTYANANTIGKYDISAQSITDLKPDDRSYLVKGNSIILKLIRNERIIRSEDINKDRVIEIWAGFWEGEGININLYQIKTNPKGATSAPLKSRLSFESTNRDAPLGGIVEEKDLDGNGEMELLVSRPTHPFTGTLYSPGKVKWVDVYSIAPYLELANRKHKSVFMDKMREIDSEIERLNGLIKKYKKVQEDNPEISMAYEVKIEESLDQISVYKRWQKKIEGILK